MKNNLNKLNIWLQSQKINILILGLFSIAIAALTIVVGLWVQNHLIVDHTLPERQQLPTPRVGDTPSEKIILSQNLTKIENQNSELQNILLRKTEILNQLNQLLIEPDSKKNEDMVKQLMSENEILTKRQKEIENDN